MFDVKGHYSLPVAELAIYSIGSVSLIFACCTGLDLLRKKYIEYPVMTLITSNEHFRRLKKFFEIV